MTWTCPNCERRYPDSGIGVPRDADADEKAACKPCSDAHATSLDDVHELPWANVEGAYLRVRQEVTDYAAVGAVADPDAHTTVGEREGELVGRAEGTGLYYDAERKDDFPTSIGPKVYLSTPEDTILEVMTDKPGNELLAFTPPEDDDE